MKKKMTTLLLLIFCIVGIISADYTVSVRVKKTRSEFIVLVPATTKTVEVTDSVTGETTTREIYVPPQGIWRTIEYWENETYTVKGEDIRSPEEIQKEVDALTAGSDLEIVVETVTQCSGSDYYATNARASVNGLEGIKERVARQVEEYKKDKQDNLTRQWAKALGDPVRLALGEFITSDIDMSFTSINQQVSITRSYQSSRSSSHSFGVGWNFNYDTRIISGVKPQAEALVEDVKIRILEMEELYNEAESAITEAVAIVTGKLEDVENVEDSIKRSIAGIKSNMGAPYPEIRERLESDIAFAQGQNGTIKDFEIRCEALLADLAASRSVLVDINASKQELMDQLVILQNEAALAKANEERNRFVTNETDPDFICYGGNKNITFIDENGNPHNFMILAEADYDSITLYPDGSVNYYPQGSATVSTDFGGDTLDILPNGTFTVTREDRSVWYYSLYGQLSRIVDVNGNEITFSYNHNNELTEINDSTGRTVFIEKINGRISKVTDPAGNVHSYEYDSQGRLVQVTDPMGISVGFTYDGHRLTSIVKPDGSKLGYFYDSNGFVTHTIDEEGNPEYFTYDRENMYTLYTNPSGIEEKHFYNEDNLDTKVEYSDGTYELFEYNPRGKVTKRTDRLGRMFSYTYDDRDNLIFSVDSTGVSQSWVYNNVDNIISHKDKDGGVTYFEYDGNGNQVAVILPDGSRIDKGYNAKGQLVKQTEPSGKVTEYMYDSNGYLSEVRENGVLTGVMEYDILGNCIKSINGAGAETSYAYNKDNSIIQVTGPDNSTFGYIYNERSDLVVVTGKNGGVSKTEYDKRHLPVKEVSPLGHIIEHTYREDGKKIETTVDGRFHTRYSYSEQGYLGAVKQVETGITVYYTYDAAGRVLTTTDGKGNTRSFVYNDNDQVIRVTDGVNGISEYEYSPGGLLKKTVGPKGNEIFYDYDELGRVYRVSNRKGVINYYEYDAGGNIILEVDALENETRYRYNSLGQLLEITNALGDKISYEYTSEGRVKKVRDPLGGVTEFTYDIMRRMTTQTNPAGDTKYVSYDREGNIIEEINELEQKTAYEYNLLNQLIGVTDNLGNTISYEYDVFGNVSKVTYPDNSTREFTADGSGKIISEIDALNNITYIQRDKAGNIEAVINPEGEVEAFIYDGNNRVTDTLKYLERISYNPQDGIDLEMMLPEALTVSKRYDEAGNLVYFQDPEGSAGAYGTTYEYDEMNRPVKELSPLGYEKSYVYDLAGNIISETDFNGNSITHSYDPLNRRVKTEYPDGTWKSFEYDPRGNIVCIKNGDMTEEKRYDRLNRLVYVKQSRSDEDIQETRYTYDALGNRLSMGITLKGETRTTRYFYDGLNRLVRVVTPDNEMVTMAYDALGRITDRIHPNGTKTEYTFNPTGTVESIKHLVKRGWGEYNYYRVFHSLGYIYDKANRRQYEINTDKELAVYNYDPAGRLTEVFYPYSWNKINHDREEVASLGLDVDRGKSWIEPEYYDFTDGEAESLRALYDGINPAVNVWDWRPFFDPSRQQLLKESFDVDKSGNIVSKTNEWGTISYIYDEAGRMTGAGNTHFLYDNNGNLIKRQTGKRSVEYSYNFDNRLTEVVYPFARGTNNGNYEFQDHKNRAETIRYTYDLSGRRISKSVKSPRGGQSRDEQYVYDGYNLVGEYRGFPERWKKELYTEYYYGGQTLLGRKKENGSAWYHQDALGSVVMMSGKKGRNYGRLSYDAYGSVYDGRFNEHYYNENMFGFTGKRYDPDLEAYSFVFRDYDILTNRWMTEDPVRDGHNWYGYVNADPVNNVDPLGLEEVYFLYTLKTDSNVDQAMLVNEMGGLAEEVLYLQQQGLDVVVDYAATRADVVNAFSDPEAMMIVLSGHGSPADSTRGRSNSIETSEGGVFSPSDLDYIQLSNNLDVVIFQSCHQGDYVTEWTDHLPEGTRVVGWSGVANTFEIARYNDFGFFDRQPRNLWDEVEDVAEEFKEKNR